MKITSFIRVMPVYQCDLQKGNYRHDFKRKSNTAYSLTKRTSFQEILENEELKKIE